MQNNFVLSCESTVDLPFSYISGRNIEVLFYTYSVDGVEYDDDMGRDPKALDRFYGFLAAVLYILLFNFLFIDPRFTLLVYDSGYLMTYFVTILASLITGSLAVKLKNIAKQSADTAYQTKVLLDTSDQLEAAKDSREMIRITCGQLANLLERTVSFYTVENSMVERKAVSVWDPDRKTDEPVSDTEKSAVLSVYEGTQTEKTAESGQLYFRVDSEDGCFGVLSVKTGKEPLSEMENTILLSVINEFTLALNNERNRQQKTEAEIRAGKERFRAGLLRSISHDLRTPLTSICGNAENLRENHAYMSEEDREKIYEDIEEDSFWLKNQMENILSVTKLESHPEPNLSVESVEDVINESLQHLDSHAREHTIRVIGNDELLAPCVDAVDNRRHARIDRPASPLGHLHHTICILTAASRRKRRHVGIGRANHDLTSREVTRGDVGGLTV